jgi:hypothetical protein
MLCISYHYARFTLLQLCHTTTTKTLLPKQNIRFRRWQTPCGAGPLKPFKAEIRTANILLPVASAFAGRLRWQAAGKSNARTEARSSA